MSNVNEDQFIMLYEPDHDGVSGALFAWFCVYENPADFTGKSYIEQWAFVNKEDADLYNRSFHAKFFIPRPVAPKNKAEWVSMIMRDGAPKFQSFMRRITLLFDYSEAETDPNNILQRIDVQGNRAVSISLDGAQDWLILQEEPWIIGERKEYYQLSLLKTLEQTILGKECFGGVIGFSDVSTLKALLHFSDFARSKSTVSKVGDTLDIDVVKYALFQDVVTMSIPPSDQSIPDDTLIIIPGK